MIIQCELQTLFTGFSNAHDGHCPRALTAFGSGSLLIIDVPLVLETTLVGVLLDTGVNLTLSPVLIDWRV